MHTEVPTSLLKRLPVVELPLLLGQKSVCCICLALFLDSLVCSIDFYICPFTNTVVLIIGILEEFLKLDSEE